MDSEHRKGFRWADDCKRAPFVRSTMPDQYLDLQLWSQEVSCVLLGWLRRSCEEVFAARLDADVHSYESLSNPEGGFVMTKM